MELLYKNKLLISIIVGLLISMVFYNYNKIDDEIEYDEETGTAYVNNNNNTDYSLYIFVGVAIVIYGILQLTEDNIDDVFTEIDTGDVPF